MPRAARGERFATPPFRLHAGDAPRPWKTQIRQQTATVATYAKEAIPMTRVLNYDNVLTCRVSDGDFRKVCEACGKEGLSRSQYLRFVVRMIADDAGNAGKGGVLLDGKSVRKIQREIVRWGYHYNQGMHALNAIKYQLEHGRCDYEWIGGKLDETVLLLTEVEDGRKSLSSQLSQLESRAIVGGE